MKSRISSKIYTRFVFTRIPTNCCCCATLRVKSTRGYFRLLLLAVRTSTHSRNTYRPQYDVAVYRTRCTARTRSRAHLLPSGISYVPVFLTYRYFLRLSYFSFLLLCFGVLTCHHRVFVLFVVVFFKNHHVCFPA